MELLNQPQYWWGPPGSGALRQPLSVVELIHAGTLDVRSAATLWLLLESGSSLVVAGGPQRIGKTTMATALLPFLPPAARVYFTRGPDDPLDVPPPRADAPVYLMVNEFSDHTPWYMSGEAICHVFELALRGARIVGTVHGDQVAEVLAAFHRGCEVSIDALARLDCVLVLALDPGPGGVARRLACCSLVFPAGDGVTVVDIARWQGEARRIFTTPSTRSVQALADKVGMSMPEAARAVDLRADELHRLTRERVTDPRAVAEAIAAFRARHGIS